MSDDQFRDSLDALLGVIASPRDDSAAHLVSEVDATLLGGLPPLEELTRTGTVDVLESGGKSQFHGAGLPAAEAETKVNAYSSISQIQLGDSQESEGGGNVDTYSVQASDTFSVPAVGLNPPQDYQQSQHPGSLEAALQQIRLIESYAAQTNISKAHSKGTGETSIAGASALKPQVTRKRNLQLTQQLRVASNNDQRTAPAVPAPPAISEDEIEGRKRRSDRNAREQARSQKIADQIADLHQLLDDADIQHKPDKYHTLVCTANYIRKLQQQSSELQHKQEEMVQSLQQISHQLTQHNNCGSLLSSAAPAVVSSSGMICFSGSESVLPMAMTAKSGAGADQTSGFPDGRIDFKWVFDFAPFASSVTSIDGRFLECNAHFERLSGYSRQELLEVPTGKTRNMSLFNILHRQHIERVFAPLSEMLQYNEETREHPPSEQRQNVSETVRLGHSDVPHKLVR